MKLIYILLRIHSLSLSKFFFYCFFVFKCTTRKYFYFT